MFMLMPVFIIIITCIISSSMKKIFREPILSFLEAEEDEREMKGKLPVGKTLAKQEIYAILNLQHRPSVLCCSVISQLFQSLDGETIRVRVLRPDLPYSTQPYILPCRIRSLSPVFCTRT